MFLFSKKYVLVTLVAAGIAAGVLFVVKDPSLSPQGRFALRGDEEVLLRWQEEWRKNMKRLSPQDAYAVFRKEVEEDPSYTKGHIAAHLFGEVVWEELGIRGTWVCGSEFDFGCFHEFFLRAVGEQGLNAVSRADETCQARWDVSSSEYLACQHGIGHGILSSLGGYGEKELLRSLEICSGLAWRDPIGGCAGGVFMEYNQRMALGHGSIVEFRKLNPEDPYEPCSQIPEQYLSSCYYHQGVWWADVSEYDYERVGALCQSIGTSELEESCILGVATSLPPRMDYAVWRVAEACDALGESILCRVVASAAFAQNPEHEERSHEMCEYGLSESARDACLHSLPFP